jgi:hypothetical protein
LELPDGIDQSWFSPDPEDVQEDDRNLNQKRKECIAVSSNPGMLPLPSASGLELSKALRQQNSLLSGKISQRNRH